MVRLEKKKKKYDSRDPTSNIERKNKEREKGMRNYVVLHVVTTN